MRPLPADMARCLGRNTTDPRKRAECDSCHRKNSPPIDHPRQVWIAPWEGHGACPDRLEEPSYASNS